ncbi:hypothetical protein J437_LFUL018307 [Ladona fulva]|uniref:Uncharacterized protein n=1 Tax=Ladona fulva TaxID=123851 RepID=A0A8K0KPV3_LADFU|nr:hypothetical protein J437_LFUL018307 [Ladona fulva]
MFSKQEQQSWIKIECARGHTARQCHQGLQEACGESPLPYRTVARWVKAFNEGRQTVADMHQAGRPRVSEEEVHTVATLVDIDRSQTIRELAHETGLAHKTVLCILKERLGMRKTASGWTHLDRYELEGEAFLRRIITLDETWATLYEPKLERGSNEWRCYGSPRKTKVGQSPTRVKVMVILVYNCDGVILKHYVPPRQTVNAQYYCSFLEHHLRPALRKKRQHFLSSPPIILHDNTRAHTAQAVAALFGRWDWEMEEPLRGIRFRTVPEIRQAVARPIRTINRTGSANGMLSLPHIWQRVLHNAVPTLVYDIFSVGMIAYLDDWLLHAWDLNMHDAERMLEFLQTDLGITLSLDKCILKPTCVIKYLGVKINTSEMVLSLLPGTLAKLHLVINIVPRLTAKDLPKAGGFVAWVVFILNLPKFLIRQAYQRNNEWLAKLWDNNVFYHTRNLRVQHLPLHVEGALLEQVSLGKASQGAEPIIILVWPIYPRFCIEAQISMTKRPSSPNASACYYLPSGSPHQRLNAARPSTNPQDLPVSIFTPQD